MSRISAKTWFMAWLFLCLAFHPAQAQRPSFDELLSRAEQALAANDLDKAITLYEKLANFYPNSAVAHNRLGYAHYKKGNDPRAIYSFRQSLALSRNNPEALHNLILASGRQADTLARESRFAEAGRNLDELIANYSWHPQHTALLYYRGRMEFLRGQPEEGLAWWKKAAAAAPDSSVARVMAAQSRPFDDKTVVGLYLEAAKKVPTEPAFDYLLGSRYLDAGRQEDAFSSFEKGLLKCREARIPFPLLSLSAAQAALSSNRIPQAIEILEEARQQRPDWASLCTLLWAAQLAAGNESKADQSLQDAFQLDGRPKLALLGESQPNVRLNTSGGSLLMTSVNAVSPSVGKATLTAGEQTTEIEIGPGDALVYRQSGGHLTLVSRASLAHGSQEGSLAPTLVAKDRRGSLYRLADALLKRPIVIVFWTFNGADPLGLLNGLGGLQARYKGNLETVAIHTDPNSQKDALRLYLSQPGTSAQLWGDPSSSELFKVKSPSVVVIDRAGRIVLRESAPTQQTFSELPAFIDNLP